MNELMTAVHNKLRGDNRKGHDYHTDCPFCGKAAKRSQTHFSYSEHGYKCHVCGEGGGLYKLAQHLGHDTERVEYTPPKPKPPKPPAAWMDSNVTFSFSAHPGRYELWQSYKPLSKATINRANLGVGVLPASRCNHERLIVPIYSGGKLVCLRGRAIGCDCGKWLASGGWSLDDLPLYNIDALPDGGVLWLVENPIDALMIGEATDYTGVATLGVTYWRDHWLEAIVEKRPSLVVVAYDNDLPGNGGAWQRQAMLSAWRKNIPPDSKVKPPRAWGVWLVNKLLRAGLPIELYDWKDAPPKTDIGSLLTQ